MKQILALIILTVFFVPNSIYAETGQQLNVDGYNLHISATKLSSDLVVTGSIKGGEKCDHMMINIHLVAEDGSQTSISKVIKGYQNSDRFTVRKKYNGSGKRWIVSDAYISTK